jgi:molybdate transport system substrate-binding protein
MLMKCFVSTLFIVICWSCALLKTSVAADQKELTISAAISLKNAFEETGRLYEAKHKGTRILFNFGASGNLARQLEGGAPVDVFASAAQQDMDAIEKGGFLVPGSRKDFAGNSIVLIVPAASQTSVTSFEGLASGKLQRIAVGNFKTVPAGRYAEEVLHHFHLLPAINKKLIFAENVRQVLDYVSRGEVDAGILYSTDARVRPKEVRVVASAQKESHRTIVYPIAMVKGTKNEILAREFISLIVSPEGKKILDRYGFNTR